MGSFASDLNIKEPVKEEPEKFKPSTEDIGKKHQTGLGFIGLGIGLGFAFFSLSILGSTRMIGK